VKSRRSKACDISQKVKKEVFKRDGGLCIICKRPGMPNSHYITRAKGGLGIPQNVGTMCIECHNAYDNGKDLERKQYIENKFREYLKSKYKNWNEKELYYDKWKNGL
jgi:5-methylcytosine-specific restriction endonuclease McrA